MDQEDLHLNVYCSAMLMANLHITFTSVNKGGFVLCYELNLCPPKNSYVETIISYVAVFGDGSSEEISRVKSGYAGGALIQ